MWGRNRNLQKSSNPSERRLSIQSGVAHLLRKGESQSERREGNSSDRLSLLPVASRSFTLLPPAGGKQRDVFKSRTFRDRVNHRTHRKNRHVAQCGCRPGRQAQLFQRLQGYSQTMALWHRGRCASPTKRHRAAMHNAACTLIFPGAWRGITLGSHHYCQWCCSLRGLLNALKFMTDDVSGHHLPCGRWRSAAIGE